ncbi:MAG TPA: serine hydrolase domain-containing protein [Bryobacteraceae bacterium]
MSRTAQLLLTPALSVLLASQTVAASLPTSRPEEVGLSAERLKRIHDVVQEHIDAKDFGGAVTLVMRKGKVVHFEAHGVMDLESNKPMRTDTLFRMASMTKPMTAASILMLMEEGKLILSDPVSKFIPEYKNPQVAVWNLPNDPKGAGYHLVPADREITLKDLLTHTSGLANGLEGPAGEFVRRANLPRGGSLAERVQRLAKLPLNFQPGTQWEYSPSTGFDTLGRVVEILSGLTLEQFFQQRIFAPLNMNNSFFTIPPDRLKDVSIVYQKTERGLVKPNIPAPPPAAQSSGPYFSGAGGLTASAEDYLQFCQMLLNNGQWNGKRLLSRKSVELMTDNAVGTLDLRNYMEGEGSKQDLTGYGFGLGVRVRRSTGASGWLGSVGDFGWAGANGTYFWIDPKEQLIGMVLMSTRVARLRTEIPNAVYQAFVD